MTDTPIVFVIFNRPEPTARVFAEIRKARPSRLFIVADGPRSGEEAEKCRTVRDIVSRIDWTCEVTRNYSDINLGCKRRVSSGISRVFEQVEEAIILEDDCLPCPDFFVYCSEMLARFRANNSIMHIGGSNFQNGRKRGNASYYFSRYMHVWGWATWRRAWQHYDVNIASWPQRKKHGLLEKAGLDRVECAFWANFFDRMHAGEIDTWDYQWVYACWLHQGLAVVPNVNLVTNIGWGPDATHTKTLVESLALPTGELNEIRHPARIRRNVKADSFSFNEVFDGRKLRLENSFRLRVLRRLGKVKRHLLCHAPFGKSGSQ